MNKESRNILILTFITFITSGLCNFNSSNLIISVLLAIIETISIISYLVLINKPMIALLLAFMQQTISLGYDLAIGVSIKDAINSYIVYGGITLACIFIHFLIIDKKKTDNKVSKRILTALNTERKPCKIPIWSKIIVYSTIVTLIMNTANSNDTISSMGLQGVFKVYGAIVMLLPVIMYAALLSTTILAYELLIIRIILEIITICNLYNLDSLTISQVVYVVIECFIFIYALYKIKVKKNERERQI